MVYVNDSPTERESPRYPIPSYFNPTPYYVYKDVRELLDRNDIPPYHLPVKNRFIHYFTKILHYGLNAENEYNDYLENRRLISMCGNVFDKELDHNEITNSDFLKLALNMLRDYIDSMPKMESGAVFAPPSFFEHDKYQIEQIIKTIETYLSDLVDPDSKIETDSEEAFCEGGICDGGKASSCKASHDPSALEEEESDSSDSAQKIKISIP